ELFGCNPPARRNLFSEVAHGDQNMEMLISVAFDGPGRVHSLIPDGGVSHGEVFLRPHAGSGREIENEAATFPCTLYLAVLRIRQLVSRG
ncbi:MAG TPA: hypothetical protein VK743_07350, partial [Steroidobacteraceae bacterium]|nr:hypothetical protein [Steroidobacteraceae bacterium]